MTRLAVRDLGWMLTWVDSAQEALDTALIAYRVAEDRRMFVPLCDQLRRRISHSLASTGTDPDVAAG